MRHAGKQQDFSLCVSNGLRMKNAGLRRVDLVCHRPLHTFSPGYLLSLWYSEEEELAHKIRLAIKKIL